MSMERFVHPDCDDWIELETMLNDFSRKYDVDLRNEDAFPWYEFLGSWLIVYECGPVIASMLTEFGFIHIPDGEDPP